MIATALQLAGDRTRHAVAVGSPFYAGASSAAAAGAPVLHKYDKPDFVQRFLSEIAAAAAQQARPASLLGPLATTIDPAVPAFDADAIDFLGSRFRKVFLPVHFRFYVAACELRCLVPGFPGPARKKVKKVELVVRRVALRKDLGGGPVVIDRDHEWAWAKVPDPGVFPDEPPEVTLALAPRITGNTHTWWPIPEGEAELQTEQRFPMTRAAGPGIDAERAIYFAFCPLGSGEMYGPRKDPPTTNPGSVRIEEDVGYTPVPTPLPAAADWTPSSEITGTPPEPPPGLASDPTAPAPLTKYQVKPAQPLVKAPSAYALNPRNLRIWRRNYNKTLGLFSGKTIDGPRPKYESPPSGSKAEGAWGYVVRCVATVEEHPGCVVEHWGPASEPVVVAPQYDPFGGRPVQIEIPSLTALKNMIGDLNAAQLAKRGGTPVAFRQPGEQPMIGGDPPEVTGHMTVNFICSFGLPLITICAYLMLNIALILLFPLKIAFSFLFSLKFCIPIPGPPEE